MIWTLPSILWTSKVCACVCVLLPCMYVIMWHVIRYIWGGGCTCDWLFVIFLWWVWFLGVRLDNKSCEVLEALLSKMQMTTLDLQRTNLEDEVRGQRGNRWNVGKCVWAQSDATGSVQWRPLLRVIFVRNWLKIDRGMVAQILKRLMELKETEKMSSLTFLLQ